jgi:hypothetical protein
MNKIKNFLTDVEWLYLAKVALVIIPVLLWEAWVYTLKGLNIATDWINVRGDKLLSKFLGT